MNGTKLKFSMTFHPQTDGQIERINQTLEDMLRVCALDFKGSWGKYIPLTKLPIIIVIKQPSRWPLMKHCMGDDEDL